MDSNTITHISLCSGYGGIDLGLKRVLGEHFRTVAYCEIESFACANLASKAEAGLLDNAPIWSDLKRFPWRKFRGLVDILSGGYPCQPFSAAGKRLGTEDPRHLWPFIANGIALMLPSVCFFENVEGHISLGLPNVIEDLAGMGYRASWGIFSASEVGAPHRRKRVFIMAHNLGERVQELAREVSTAQEQHPSWDNGRNALWPSRPGQPQYEWEPPRVVGNAAKPGLPFSGGKCGEMGKPGAQQESERSTGEEHGQAQSCVGLFTYGNPRELGEAELTYGNDTSNAYQVLLSLWQATGEEEIQWTVGGSCNLLAEAILQSGVQLSAFPQRVCFFVWCIQTGNQAEAFGLPELWLNKSAGNPSQGQEPLQQFRRELAYALRVLSFRIALERGEIALERTPTMQGVRESCAEARILSEALVSLQEVWQSQLNEETRTIRAYSEAANLGSNRTDELRLLGNGVVPATAALAFRTLWKELTA